MVTIIAGHPLGSLDTLEGWGRAYLDWYLAGKLVLGWTVPGEVPKYLLQHSEAESEKSAW